MMNQRKSWSDVVKVHPACDSFPMLAEPELRELGEDIKKNGLRNPVVLWMATNTADAACYLLDGRNRLAAMEMVGMKTVGGNAASALPLQLDIYRLVFGKGLSSDGEAKDVDPAAYVISANIRRRHLTPGQRAKLALKALEASETFTPETSAPAEVSKGGRGRKGQAAKVAELAEVSQDTAQRAINEAEGKPRPPKVAHREDPPTKVDEVVPAIVEPVVPEAEPTTSALLPVAGMFQCAKTLTEVARKRGEPSRKQFDGCVRDARTIVGALDAIAARMGWPGVLEQKEEEK